MGFRCILQGTKVLFSGIQHPIQLAVTGSDRARCRPSLGSTQAMRLIPRLQRSWWADLRPTSSRLGRLKVHFGHRITPPVRGNVDPRPLLAGGEGGGSEIPKFPSIPWAYIYIYRSTVQSPSPVDMCSQTRWRELEWVLSETTEAGYAKLSH